eukprot:339201_1
MPGSQPAPTPLLTILGSLSVVFSMLLFNTSDAIVKLSHLSVSQLTFGRFLIQFLIAVLWWNICKPSGQYVNNWYGDKPYILNIWVRGLCCSIYIICFYYAVKVMPVGDVTIFHNQSGLIIAFLAKVFLNEKLPKLYPILIITSVLGTFFVSQPSFLQIFVQKYINNNSMANIEQLNIGGIIAALIGMLFCSFERVLIRSARQTHFIQFEIVSSGLTVFFTIPIVVIFNLLIGNTEFEWYTNWNFDMFSCITMILIGIIGFSALCFVVKGYQLGDATKVSWFEYIDIIYACIIQVVVFNDALNLFEWIGLVLIVIGCALNVGEQYYDYKILKTSVQHQNQEMLELLETTIESNRDEVYL